MRKWFLAIVLSTSTVPTNGPIYWAIFGPIEVSTEVPVGYPPAPPLISTGPATFVVLKSSTSADCYKLNVTPNGTLKTEWTKCP